MPLTNYINFTQAHKGTCPTTESIRNLFDSSNTIPPEQVICKMTPSEPKQPADLQNQPLPFNLTDLDRETLLQTDEEFVPHDWDDLKRIIGKLMTRRN